MNLNEAVKCEYVWYPTNGRHPRGPFKVIGKRGSYLLLEGFDVGHRCTEAEKSKEDAIKTMIRRLQRAIKRKKHLIDMMQLELKDE